MLRRLAPQGLALLIGLISATLAFLINMPLPWMLGSMVGVTIAAMSRVPFTAPDRLRPIVVPVVGVMLGSTVNADIFQKLGPWALTLLILPLVLICSATISYVIYRRIGHYDHTTAFYSAMPGGLNEMLLLGSGAGGNERRIALAHAARVLLVIFMVAIVFGVFMGVRSDSGAASWTPLTAPSVLDYALLLGCAVIGAPLAKQINLPAAPMFGPMTLSGFVHLMGWTHVAPPTIFIIGAQIVVGTVIGCRFIGATLRDVGQDLGLAALGTALALTAAGLMAFIAITMIDMPLSQAFLAFAPGGLTEMSLMTLAIGQDVAFVTVAHLIRVTMVIAIAPMVFGLLVWKRG